MAGFARRQTMLQEQGARQQADVQQRRRETAPQIDQTDNTRYALQQNESAGENERNAQKPFIKREVSEAPEDGEAILREGEALLTKNEAILKENEALLKSTHEYSLHTRPEKNMSDSEKAPRDPKIPVFEHQSSPEPPRPPSPLPPSAGRLARDCACPTSLICPARENPLIDCRTLVLDYKKWEIRERENHVPE
jgi:hypothetical protein